MSETRSFQRSRLDIGHIGVAHAHLAVGFDRHVSQVHGLVDIDALALAAAANDDVGVRCRGDTRRQLAQRSLAIGCPGP